MHEFITVHKSGDTPAAIYPFEWIIPAGGALLCCVSARVVSYANDAPREYTLVLYNELDELQFAVPQPWRQLKDSDVTYEWPAIGSPYEITQKVDNRSYSYTSLPWSNTTVLNPGWKLRIEDINNVDPAGDTGVAHFMYMRPTKKHTMLYRGTHHVAA